MYYEGTDELYKQQVRAPGETPVDSLVKPVLTIHDVRLWWHQKRSDIADDDAIGFLFVELARIDTENSEMKELLRDIYRVCGASSRASHREQTAIFQRLRKALEVSV